MTLHTSDITLSPQWQQITDGTKSVFVEVDTGSIRYVSADSEPQGGVRGHRLASGEECTFTPPTQIWARADGSPTAILAVTVI